MKINRSPLSGWNRFLIFSSLFTLLVLAVPRSFAQEADPIAAARSSSTAWIAMIDQGKYEESYFIACPELKTKVPEKTWLMVLQTFRGMFGEVVNRTESSHIYKPDGIDGLPGECMVIIYKTSFKKLPEAIELVVMKKEFGKWHGAGYNAGPKEDPNAPAQAPVSNTQTETHTTKTPPTQKLVPEP